MAAKKIPVSKRSASQLTALKWNKGGDGVSKDAHKGVKPLPEPMTLQQMVVVLLMHVCRKYLLMSIGVKIAAYAVVIVFGSLLCDFFPLPRFRIYHKGSVLNQYFAKLSWGWTLILVGSFVALTSYIYCCGNVTRIRKHLTRLLVGTACWYTWTTILFPYIEAATGFCIGDAELRNLDRETCLKRGYRWRGFDISGHSFLLIYCCMIIHEEAKAFRGWERIRDLIREVDYDDDSPLKTLSDYELQHLKTSYERFNHYVKASFGAITLLCLLWDFMLVGTILYFHSMAQKVAGALVAIATWFVTYHVWFLQELSPGLPGHGPFKYVVETKASTLTAAENRRRSIVGLRQVRFNRGEGQTYENDSVKTA